jgi:hypothetical protein
MLKNIELLKENNLLASRFEVFQTLAGHYIRHRKLANLDNEVHLLLQDDERPKSRVCQKFLRESVEKIYTKVN